jgi:hypothetical protein
LEGSSGGAFVYLTSPRAGLELPNTSPPIPLEGTTNLASALPIIPYVSEGMTLIFIIYKYIKNKL